MRLIQVSSLQIFVLLVLSFFANKSETVSLEVDYSTNKLTTCMSSCSFQFMSKFCHKCITRCYGQTNDKIELTYDNKYLWDRKFRQCVYTNTCDWKVCKPRGRRGRRLRGFRNCRQDCKEEAGFVRYDAPRKSVNRG